MPTPPTRRLQHAVIAGVVLFCVAILVLAYVSYQHYEADYRTQTQARLLAIAEMKAAEVSAWRRERVADGQFYADNQAVIALWRRVLNTPADADAIDALRDLLGRMQRNHQYDRISIHDASGIERIAAPAPSVDDGHMTHEVVAAGRDGRSRFLDLHQDGTNFPHMAIIVPLQSTPTASMPSLGAVVLRINAQRALMPFVNLWPVPAETAETLVVRREGDEVLYLNALLQPGSAAEVTRVPVGRTDLPAVRAALGESGTAATVDRYGVPVVAAFMPIADSPWALVASTAQAELYGPLRERAAITIVIVVLLLAAGAAGIGFILRGQNRRLAEAERAHLTALQSMAQVVEASPVVLFQWRAEPGWPVDWVSANVSRWGYSPDALMANTPPFSSIVHEEDLTRVNQEVQRHTTEGSNEFVQEYRIRTTDGRVLWVDDRTTVVRHADGSVARYEGTLADITERKHLQAQFVQAQKMETVGRLAGGVAHDFNNLLTVINGYAEFALTDIPEGDPLHEMVQEIYDAGQRASGLTRQLLAFSRRQVVQPVALDLNVVAGQMHRMLERLIGEDIRLTFDLDPGLWRIRADAGQFEQVIMNLAVNARDAMPEGGTLVVTTRNLDDDSGQIMLAVADTGCGMDEATQQRLFEPFFTTKRPGQGTGLGLATVYGIVTQAGGRIELSSAPGRGTTFRIYLPRLEGEGGSDVVATRPAGVVRGTERILIVEDEESLRRIAQRILTSAGYTTICAANGEEAIAVLEAQDAPVDLLLTDVVMPGMSGHELAARIKVTHPYLKVLFASGYLPDAFPNRAQLGADVQFLAKPYSPSSLTSKVRDVLDRT